MTMLDGSPPHLSSVVVVPRDEDEAQGGTLRDAGGEVTAVRHSMTENTLSAGCGTLPRRSEPHDPKLEVNNG